MGYIHNVLQLITCGTSIHNSETSLIGPPCGPTLSGPITENLFNVAT